MNERLWMCTCGTPSHQFITRFDPEWPMSVDFSVHLTPLPRWQRVIVAFKYLFGMRDTYMAYDDVILTLDQVREYSDYLRDVLIEMLRHREQGRAKRAEAV